MVGLPFFIKGAILLGGSGWFYFIFSLLRSLLRTWPRRGSTARVALPRQFIGCPLTPFTLTVFGFGLQPASASVVMKPVAKSPTSAMAQNIFLHD